MKYIIMAKISMAVPPIATKRSKPPIARYKLPLEEDMLRKRGHIATTTFSEVITPPGKETSIYWIEFKIQKRLIVLKNNDRDIETIMKMKRALTADVAVELTSSGPHLYVRDSNGIELLDDVLSSDKYLLEISLSRTMQLYPKLDTHSLYGYGLYAVINIEGSWKIERVSIALLRKAYIDKEESRFFFGRKNPSIDSADRVVIE